MNNIKSTKVLMVLLILAMYLLIAYCYFGIGVLSHLHTRLAGTGDDFTYIWSLSWWRYAFSHHLNPFITDFIWAPRGYNITRATTLLGVFLLAWPLQLLLGTEAAYNIVFIFSPALAAWTLFLLCYYLTKRWIPAIIAGYLFGFSSYMLYHMFGHMNLISGVFAIPLVILLGMLHLNRAISTKLFIITAGLCLTFLFLVSCEMLATFTLCGGIAFIIALIIFKNERKIIMASFWPIVGAYMSMAVLISPYLYYFFTHRISGDYLATPVAYSNDLLSLFTPSLSYLVATPYSVSLTTSFADGQNAYLGIPLLLICLIFMVKYWSTAYGKYFILLSLIFTMISFGPILHIAGRGVMTLLPVKWLFEIPLIKYSLAQRYGLYVSIVVALIVAFWLANQASTWKYLLVSFAVLFLIPCAQLNRRPQYLEINQYVPTFFSSGQYKEYLQNNETVIMWPAGVDLYCQAMTNYYFKLGIANIGTIPSPITDPMDFNLMTGKFDAATLKKILAQKHIAHIIISDSSTPPSWITLLDKLNFPVEHVGGVRIYTAS